MNAQYLKNSILQLAIKGKLVDQRKEEGTAKELLEQIKATKEQLIKENKIKKQKALPEITEDEIPFDIPENWEWVRVGDIGSWSAGATPLRSNPEYYRGNIPWLKTGDLNDGYIDEVPEYISEKALEKTSVRLNPVGSVLMAMYGATIGKLGIINIEATTNQACCACIPYEGVYNKYIFYYLMGQRRNYIKMGAGGAQPNISKEKITTSLIPLPPLEEQKRIVAKIEELLPYVKKYDKAYSEVGELNKKFPEDMKKSILQYAIKGKLVEQREEEGTAEELIEKIKNEKKRLIKEKAINKETVLDVIKEEEIPFDIPQNWKWVKLGDVLSVYGGKRIPAGRSLTDESTGYKYIRVADMKNGSVAIDNIKYIPQDIYEKIKKYTISYDDVYITVAGTIGQVGTIPKELNNANLTENANKLVVYFNYKKYIYYMLNSHLVQYQIKEATTKVGQPKLAIKRIKELIIPIPPLAEQKRIVEKIEELLPYTNQLVM